MRTDITPEEHKALVYLEANLRSGRFVHKPISEDGEVGTGKIRVRDRKLGFNMGTPGEHIPGCGTVACIGGWVSAIMQHDGALPNEPTIDFDEMDKYVAVGCSPALFTLFYPSDDHYHNITPMLAADRIRDFLASGDDAAK